MLLYPTHEPAVVEHSFGFEAAYLTIHQPVEGALRPRAWRDPAGAAAMAARSLEALADHAAELSGPAFHVACTHVTALIHNRHLDAQSRTELTQLIVDYVTVNIADPLLSTSTIARALGWSPRRIQLEMQKSDTTVSALIRSERLARAHAALADPSSSERSVARIGMEHGFTNPSAFTASFRRAFGLTPSEARAIAREAAGG